MAECPSALEHGLVPECLSAWLSPFMLYCLSAWLNPVMPQCLGALLSAFVRCRGLPATQSVQPCSSNPLQMPGPTSKTTNQTMPGMARLRWQVHDDPRSSTMTVC
uniref:Uncharacterized protein n=1 Tax=Dunaliella tertiolecta TaxID=3047 RepID=A0A7S3QU47_DUNTE